MIYFVIFILAVEAYYWFWWLPRNWRTVPDAVNLRYALHDVYGIGSDPLTTKHLTRRYFIQLKK